VLVLPLFERVLLDPLFERVEPPLRPEPPLRDVVEPPDVRFVAPLRVPPLVVVLRFVVLRDVPVPDRLEEPARLDVVPVREEVERPVVLRVVVPRLPPLVVVLRFVVLREPPLLRGVVALRAVVFVPVVLRGVVFAPVVFRALVFVPVVLRAVPFALVVFAPVVLRAVVLERFDVDELCDVFDPPLVFFPVDLVRANALRLLSSDNPGRRATTESTPHAKRIVKTRSDVIRKRA
jgi:hypothetical protein